MLLSTLSHLLTWSPKQLFECFLILKGSWNQKHLQRMEELEAEEEAAEHEDIVDEYGTSAPLALANKRPVRAIKIPKLPAEREPPALRPRETDLEAVSPSPQRGGRGTYLTLSSTCTLHSFPTMCSHGSLCCSVILNPPSSNPTRRHRHLYLGAYADVRLAAQRPGCSTMRASNRKP